MTTLTDELNSFLKFRSAHPQSPTAAIELSFIRQFLIPQFETRVPRDKQGAVELRAMKRASSAIKEVEEKLPPYRPDDLVTVSRMIDLIYSQKKELYYLLRSSALAAETHAVRDDFSTQGAALSLNAYGSFIDHVELLLKASSPITLEDIRLAIESASLSFDMMNKKNSPSLQRLHAFHHALQEAKERVSADDHNKRAYYDSSLKFLKHAYITCEYYKKAAKSVSYCKSVSAQFSKYSTVGTIPPDSRLVPALAFQLALDHGEKLEDELKGFYQEYRPQLVRANLHQNSEYVRALNLFEARVVKEFLLPTHKRLQERCLATEQEELRLFGALCKLKEKVSGKSDSETLTKYQKILQKIRQASSIRYGDTWMASKVEVAITQEIKQLTLVPAAEMAPVVAKEPVKPAAAAIAYHPRVTRWFSADPFMNDPAYKEKNYSEPVKHEIRAQHSFALVMDSFLEKYGLRHENQVSFVGEMFRKGKTLRCLFTYAFDKNKTCYHRYASIKTTNQLIQEYVQKGFYELDFPPLGSVSSAKSEAIGADGSYVVSETPSVLTIADPKNEMTIRLCKISK